MTKTHAWTDPSDASKDYSARFAASSDDDDPSTLSAASPDNDPSQLSASAPGVSAAAPPLAQVLYLTEPNEAGAINVADINQGQMGDCFLLSSIGEIVLQNPATISNMIHANANGTCGITLYEASTGGLPRFGTTSFKQVTETINNNFPSFTVNGGATQDVMNGQKEIWPQVLEKGVKKLDGGWAAIANGGSPIVAMEELTGQAATLMRPANVTLATLQNFVNAGDLVVMDTLPTGTLPNGLVNDHAYMFKGVTGSGGSAAVNLINPWGFDQPSPILVSRLSRGFAEVDIGHLP